MRSLALVFLLTSAQALAQSFPPDASPSSRRSPSTAAGLSVAAVLVPAAVGAAQIAASETADGGAFTIGLGLVLGPAAGHLYAGDSPWAGGALVRTGGVALAAAGILMRDIDGLACFGSDLSPEACDRAERTQRARGTALTVAGAGLVAASTVYDVLRAGRAARRRNARVVAAPAVDPVTGTTVLSVRATF